MFDLGIFLATIAFYAGMATYIKSNVFWIGLIGVVISMSGLQYLLVSVR